MTNTPFGISEAWKQFLSTAASSHSQSSGSPRQRSL